MPPQLSFTEMSHLAWILSSLSMNETTLAQTALAWTFRNRLEACGGQGGEQPFLEAVGCPDIAAPAKERRLQASVASDFQSPDYCRAFARLCSVWGDEQPDPTEGALSFHRHSELPSWAVSCEPCALIGGYFFYDKTLEPLCADSDGENGRSQPKGSVPGRVQAYCA